MTISPTIVLPRSRARTLSLELATVLTEQIRGATFPVGTKLPKEAELMEQFDVSRTVVREAISSLQAAGLVETRHGIGTFVSRRDDGFPFQIRREQLTTLHDTIAVMELRLGVEVEAAALAAARRTEDNILRMQEALTAFDDAVRRGHDASAADLEFHSEIALATQNEHFVQMLKSLGTAAIPRSRLQPDTGIDDIKRAYLQRVNEEHRSILTAIRNGDADNARAAARTHLSNSRERLKRRAEEGANTDATTTGER